MFTHKTGSSRYPTPYRLTADGDIDIQERRLTNVGSAAYGSDAITLDDCISTIQNYVRDYEVLELDERNEQRVYDVNKARIVDLANPVDEEDAVNLAFLKSYVDSRLNELTKTEEIKPEDWFEPTTEDVFHDLDEHNEADKKETVITVETKPV